MAEKEAKQGSKYKASVNYPYGGSSPRMEILRDNVAMSKPMFPMTDDSDEKTRKKAEEYAAELQRETRGKKAGGIVSSASKRADGCAQRGKTRGKMV